MKINGVKLDKKNFWIPALISSGLSFLIIFFIVIFLFFKTITWGIPGIIAILQICVLLSFIVFLPSFFIIRRLLNTKPKKVFYFELPILMVIYSALIAINNFIGLTLAGPIGMEGYFYLMLIFAPALVVALWLSIVTISLYFYYKKNNFFKK